MLAWLQHGELPVFEAPRLRLSVGGRLVRHCGGPRRAFGAQEVQWSWETQMDLLQVRDPPRELAGFGVSEGGQKQRPPGAEDSTDLGRAGRCVLALEPSGWDAAEMSAAIPGCTGGRSRQAREPIRQ